MEEHDKAAPAAGASVALESTIAQPTERPLEPSVARPPEPRRLSLQFTGSGSEYFRIWIVNLLLSLVTLGLYLPHAKARRLRYFYANTLVDGEALAFHGDPWRMFRGFVLLAVLMGCYAVAGQMSPTSGFIAFLVLCAVWPALWQSSLSFRLSNTSWRGLRFRFLGSKKDAYLTLLPTYLPTIALVGVQAFFAKDLVASDGKPEGPALAWMGTIVLVWYLLTPWMLWSLKRYQHGAYAFASQRTRMPVGLGTFYLMALKALGVLLLALVAIVGMIFLGGWLSKGNMTWMIGSVMLGYLIFFVITAPYFTARVQNLVWGHTEAQALRFDSQLSFGSLALLTLKNWLLTAVTLGLYRPFAAVRTAKLRLESLSIHCSEDPAEWMQAAMQVDKDAAGEAAGDFFGIDVGL